MAMLYFEDGTKEMILNPYYDFRRVIEERLGKESADLFEEIVEESGDEKLAELSMVVSEAQDAIKETIKQLPDDESCSGIVDTLESLITKLNKLGL